MHSKFILASVLLTLFASTCPAGTFTPILTVAARYDNDVNFNSLPLHLDQNGSVQYGAGLYAINVSFTAQAASDEKGWLSTAFNISPTSFNSGSLTKSSLLGWDASTAQLDINGNLPGGLTAVFQPNIDADPPNDLNGIVVALAGSTLPTTANDTRNLVGTSGGPASTGPLPAYLGTFYVNWNGGHTSEVRLTQLQYSFSKDNGTPGIFTDDFAGPTTDVTGTATSLSFGACFCSIDVTKTTKNNVDPNTPGVLSHTFFASLDFSLPHPPITWGDLQFASFTPLGGIVTSQFPVAAALPTFDSLTHKFDWSTIGAPAGSYKWTLSASAGDDSDTGFLIVNITQVPEPSTMSFAAVALLASLGLFRHRGDAK